MLIHKLPLPNDLSVSYNKEFLAEWFFSVLQVLSINFIIFQFLEDGEYHELFGMKDSDNKTIGDYFNEKSEEGEEDKIYKSWFNNASEYISDEVNWSGGENIFYAIKYIVNEEFFNFYQKINESSIISAEGKTLLGGFPSNKLGRNFETIIALIYIFFKMDI
jgi:hypothetical protein